MFYKKIKFIRLIIFLAIGGVFISFTNPALADIIGVTHSSVSTIIGRMTDWLLGIVAGLAILFIIIGGIYYVTAAGDENRITTAKKMITFSVIGLIFVLISYSIVITINKMITG